MTDGQRKCRYCSEDIKASARKCKHCGEWLDGTKTHHPRSGGSGNTAVKGCALLMLVMCIPTCFSGLMGVSGPRPKPAKAKPVVATERQQAPPEKVAVKPATPPRTKWPIVITGADGTRLSIRRDSDLAVTRSFLKRSRVMTIIEYVVPTDAKADDIASFLFQVARTEFRGGYLKLYAEWPITYDYYGYTGSVRAAYFHGMPDRKCWLTVSKVVMEVGSGSLSIGKFRQMLKHHSYGMVEDGVAPKGKMNEEQWGDHCAQKFGYETSQAYWETFWAAQKLLLNERFGDYTLRLK